MLTLEALDTPTEVGDEFSIGEDCKVVVKNVFYLTVEVVGQLAHNVRGTFYLHHHSGRLNKPPSHQEVADRLHQMWENRTTMAVYAANEYRYEKELTTCTREMSLRQWVESYHPQQPLGYGSWIHEDKLCILKLHPDSSPSLIGRYEKWKTL